jgi:hypothetical protein
VIFTLPLGRSAYVTGKRVSYAWRGRTYVAAGKWYLGVRPGVRCWSRRDEAERQGEGQGTGAWRRVWDSNPR